MDDLNDNPQKVAEDIIKQATSLGFKQEATVRIVRILETYHQLQNELAKLKDQKQTEADVSCDGTLAWIMEGNQRVAGPFCAYCYRKNGELNELIDLKKGEWQCPKCEKYLYDDSFKIPTRARRSPAQF